MLGLKLVALLVACITLVIASPTPTHNHKDCDRNYFWWSRKGRCLPYGGIRGVIVPPKHHCGRWYWHTNLGYCVPPQPDWSDPQCPAGWRWDDEAYSCLPSAPSLPDSGYGTGGLVLDSVGRRTFGGVLSRFAWRLAGRLFFQLFQTDGRVRVTGTGTATDSVCLVRSGTGRTLYAGLVIDGMREPRVASGDTKPGYE
ncbi:hypothetical protein RHS01_05504 [Rhizoctonia solani]|uniref:Chitin-binding type-2 domain-containing protein n=1 Tax=Rhizoctonia solani TaxID=456999 RepID=A0A8H7IB44_9AGAM|nr:hypothetical protein RHS01_05504 [Rhizoctonia solani]